ncbi:MAG: response regulator [Candidatus Brocadiae bacterium]|nr:response regulator [Candidatus Brocadiia bacterium]
MIDKFTMVTCLTYAKELQYSIEKLDARNVDISILPSTCCSLKNDDILSISHLIHSLENSGKKSHILMPYVCTGCRIDKAKMKNCCFSNIQRCHDLIAPITMLNHFIEKNYYIVTAGWVIQWENFLIQRWKFSQETAKAFFQEAAKEILVLDTGIYEGVSVKLKDFCCFIDRPFTLFPIGIEFYKANIKSIMDDCQIQELKQEIKNINKESRSKISDFSMVLDIIPALAGITSEDEIVSRTINLFLSIFGPQHIAFIQIVGGNIVKVTSSLDKSYTMEEIEKMINFIEDYWVNQEKTSFYIKVSYASETIAYIMVENILFPEYLNHYLNLSLILKSFIGLVLSNSRHYHELEIAKSHAEAASKAKSEFLANMSHEIRTPLNAVIGFTDLLMKTPMSTIQKQYAQNANTSGQALLNIINDILDFSKIEAGKLELEIIKTDIMELLEQTADIVKYSAEQKGLELLMNIKPSIPRYAEVDAIRLKQILVNLCSNAIKFTEKGEVELKLEFQAIDEKKGIYTFSIRDTGIGIKEEQKQKLFKSFSQADSSTTRKFGGTGLGLVISDILAKKMGGKIQLNSQFSKGSVFYFSIETPYFYGDKEEENLLLKHVMVIDDNDNNRKILQENFAFWGIEYTGYDNGLSALKILEKKNKFDLLIVDYHMPYIDGLKVIRIIRENLKLSQEKMPIILLHSSCEDQKLLEECQSLGIDFHLVKPIKFKELLVYLKHIPKRKGKESPAIIPKEETSAPSMKSKEATILVAEDVPVNMLLMKSLISNILPDAKIIEALDGIEAIEAMQKQKIDIIFMDIQMPGMDGIEATKKIREYEAEINTHIPIIALTAGILKEEKEKCLGCGMDDFISKPINVKELMAVLKKYLQIL